MLSNNADHAVAGFEEGAPGVTRPSSASPRHGVFLTDVIAELGFAGRASIAEAEDTARHSGQTVEQVLLDRGAIDETQLSRAIAERHGLDHVDLEQFDVDMSAAGTVSRAVAERCGAVPVAFAADGALIVALQDSVDSLAIRRIETATGREVRPAVAAVGAIKRLIERLPEEPSAPAPEPEVPRIKSQRELQVDEGPAREEEPARDEQPPRSGESGDSLASFDGLSMDLGPTTMEPTKQDAEDVAAEANRRAERLERELTEAKGRIAELERRLEEFAELAEEAAATGEKLRSLGTSR